MGHQLPALFGGHDDLLFFSQQGNPGKRSFVAQARYLAARDDDPSVEQDGRLGEIHALVAALQNAAQDPVLALPVYHQAEPPCVSLVPFERRRLQHFRGRRSQIAPARGANLGQQDVLRGMLQMARGGNRFLVVGAVGLRGAAQRRQDFAVQRIVHLPNVPPRGPERFELAPITVLKPLAVFDFQVEHLIKECGLSIDNIENLAVGAPGFPSRDGVGSSLQRLEKGPPLGNRGLFRRFGAGAAEESGGREYALIDIVILIVNVVLVEFTGYSIDHQADRPATDGA